MNSTPHKVRLLLCDDHALFRAGMKALLARQPTLEVVGEAADGQAALEEAERLRPDVVLMDIEMPRLSGIEATRRLTQATKEAKVLVLTMYLEDLFTIPVNLAGLPGLSIPCGFGAKGRPVGLQVIGDYFSEARMLAAAHAYQRATDWHQRVPKAFA